MTHIFNEHQMIETEDGTTTLFSEKYQENCHSLSGATDETEFHYIQGCKVLEKASRGNLNLLEVGLGTGLGITLTIDKILELENFFPTQLYSLEESDELIDHFKHLVLEKYQHLEPNLCEQNSLYDRYELKNVKMFVTIIKGDARKSLLRYSHSHPMKINAIYQDAFSPKRNPVLWTVQWFSLLKDIADVDCLLSTYSSSISIQKSLIEAGWKIHNGGPFGRKRSCTRAQLVGESNSELLIKVNQSSIPALLDGSVFQ